MDTYYTGKKIAELRKAKDWTQKDIAERMHVSVAAVSKWERGLNYPDLSLMEPLAESLETSVSYLLGLENEEPEQVIRNIAEISVAEKEKSSKGLLINLCTVFITCTLFIGAAWIWYVVSNNNRAMLKMFEFSGTAVYNLSAVLIGFTAWIMGVVSMFSRKSHWKIYTIISGLLCAISLYIPSLTVDLIARFEYLSTIEDISWAYNYGGAILLIGTLLLNICSIVIHRDDRNMKKSRCKEL